MTLPHLSYFSYTFSPTYTGPFGPENTWFPWVLAITCDFPDAEGAVGAERFTVMVIVVLSTFTVTFFMVYLLSGRVVSPCGKGGVPYLG